MLGQTRRSTGRRAHTTADISFWPRVRDHDSEWGPQHGGAFKTRKDDSQPGSCQPSDTGSSARAAAERMPPNAHHLRAGRRAATARGSQPLPRATATWRGYSTWRGDSRCLGSSDSQRRVPNNDTAPLRSSSQRVQSSGSSAPALTRGVNGDGPFLLAHPEGLLKPGEATHAASAARTRRQGVPNIDTPAPLRLRAACAARDLSTGSSTPA
jgi:hypothetical protein